MPDTPANDAEPVLQDVHVVDLARGHQVLELAQRRVPGPCLQEPPPMAITALPLSRMKGAADCEAIVHRNEIGGGSLVALEVLHQRLVDDRRCAGTATRTPLLGARCSERRHPGAARSGGREAACRALPSARRPCRRPSRGTRRLGHPDRRRRAMPPYARPAGPAVAMPFVVVPEGRQGVRTPPVQPAARRRPAEPCDDGEPTTPRFSAAPGRERGPGQRPRTSPPWTVGPTQGVVAAGPERWQGVGPERGCRRWRPGAPRPGRSDWRPSTATAPRARRLLARAATAGATSTTV